MSDSGTVILRLLNQECHFKGMHVPQEKYYLLEMGEEKDLDCYEQELHYRLSLENTLQ